MQSTTHRGIPWIDSIGREWSRLEYYMPGILIHSTAYLLAGRHRRKTQGEILFVHSSLARWWAGVQVDPGYYYLVCGSSPKSNCPSLSKRAWLLRSCRCLAPSIRQYGTCSYLRSRHQSNVYRALSYGAGTYRKGSSSIPSLGERYYCPWADVTRTSF